ncbi:hypothetical protein [Brachybacterium timonense]|uniref:hypothetical protein n=1 Tax=Brachybacterium timonense TaxID=2050896 RepID=UPI001482AFC6|nr:hypothetical protein [Brachybacterium timonense]
MSENTHPRWTQEHVVRLSILVCPSSPSAAAAVDAAVGAWFAELTPTSDQDARDTPVEHSPGGAANDPDTAASGTDAAPTASDTDTAPAASNTAASPSAPDPASISRLSGGSVLAYRIIETGLGDATRLLTVLSGGEDGLDSAGTEAQHLQDILDEHDPGAARTALEQWQEDDGPWITIPPSRAAAVQDHRLI